MLNEDDVLDVLDLLVDAGVSAWVDGGWGVDALVGHTTRPHDDLDLVLPRHQLDAARQALAAAGFTTVLRDLLPTALALADGAGRAVDLHPVTGSGRDGGDQLLPDGQRFRYPAPVTGTIGGRTIPCVDAATQVRCHLGYPPRDKDHHDMAHLHARTAVALPAEYRASGPGGNTQRDIPYRDIA
ncbi:MULTISPECIES: nucleotidyltransferase domain-containing protein [Kitasatospora]|uniref:Amino acid transporter n=1 Tax=Kitasatospora cathayae TaxID=3004092 RepID=A0ABY7QE54_9ACTN|nr:amino acid transporter [Kitasatospora sp. HUAS 3-15]WBP91003.1 amino acid transporter [Kitasatospora sp. HUAS 3-15]